MFRMFTGYVFRRPFSRYAATQKHASTVHPLQQGCLGLSFRTCAVRAPLIGSEHPE